MSMQLFDNSISAFLSEIDPQDRQIVLSAILRLDRKIGVKDVRCLQSPAAPAFLIRLSKQSKAAAAFQ